MRHNWVIQESLGLDRMAFGKAGTLRVGIQAPNKVRGKVITTDANFLRVLLQFGDALALPMQFFPLIADTSLTRLRLLQHPTICFAHPSSSP